MTFTIDICGHSISLDKKSLGAHSDFISHAHTDHITAAKKSSGVIAGVETMALIKEAYNITPKISEFNLDIELLDSGHMLGAKQIYINNDDYESIVYSGDYTLHDIETAKKICIPHADIAIVDSTYPYPDIKFNDREYQKNCMIEWTDRMMDRGIVLFSAFAMGKAQELVSILNGNGIIPVVSPKIAKINKIYRSFGVKLEYNTYGDTNYDEKLSDNFVGIVDTRKIFELSSSLKNIHKKEIYTAITTGFSKFMRFNTDAQFALSDHADFDQATSYIEEVGAKRIFTYGQNKEVFAKNLKTKGYNAEAFKESIKISKKIRMISTI